MKRDQEVKYYLYRWVLTCLLIIASVLRLYQLGAESLWKDELIQVTSSQYNWWETIYRSSSNQGSTPLIYLITHWVLFIDKSEGILRLPSVIFGVASVWVLYLLGKLLHRELSGLTSAAILAISPLHIYYGQEVRVYSLAILMILLTVYTFYLAINNQSLKNWIFFTVLAIVSVYTHYYTLLTLAALGLWVLFFKREFLLRCSASIGITVFAFLPWLWYDIIFPGTINSNPFQFNLPALGLLIGSLFLPSSIINECGKSCDIGIAAGILLVSILIVLVLLMKKVEIETIFLPLLIIILGLPGILLLDYFGNFFFAIRQVLIFFPFILLLVVIVLIGITGKFSPIVAIIFSIIALAFFWPQISQIYSTQTKQDFRGLAHYLIINMDSEDVLFTTTPNFLLFYEPGLADLLYKGSDSDLLSTVRVLKENGHTAWFVPIGKRAKIYSAVFNEFKRQRYPGIKSPLLYAIPKPNNW